MNPSSEVGYKDSSLEITPEVLLVFLKLGTWLNSRDLRKYKWQKEDAVISN